MAQDFMKKEPTKNEKMFYELFMQQEMLDRRLWTTSSFVTAMAILSNTDPKKVAELLTTGQDKIKDFSQKINEEIDRIEQEQKKNQPADAENKDSDHSHHGHDHSHDHSHEGNDHEHYDHQH